MKSALMALLLLMSVASFAQDTTTKPTPENNYDDMFGGGNDEFEYERFNNHTVMVQIRRDMEVACDYAGICTLSAVTSHDRRFTASFNIGEGNPWMNGGYGGFGNGGGTTVIVPGTNGYNQGNQDYWGVNLKFTSGSCVQTVKVPRSLYIALNRYMYGLMSEDGGTRRGFTPADEAMIMFYSTVMKQATGCTAATNNG